MADDTIQVVIAADASGLVAGTATAKSEINKIVEALSILQRSVHATSLGMTSELVGAINGLNGNLNSVVPSAQRATREMENFHRAAGSGGHGGGGHGGAGQLLFEVHALFDELSSGRSHQAIGTLANLEFILYGINPAFAAATVGAVALGAAVYLTVDHFKELHKTLDETRQALAFSGNAQFVDPKAIDEAAAKLRDLKSIWNTLGLSDKGFSEAEVSKVASSFAQMGDASNDTIKGMALAMSTMWQQFGADEKEASKNIVEVFSKPLAPIDEIAKHLHGLTDEERARLKAAQDTASPLNAQAAILDILAQRERNANAVRAQGLRDQIAAQQLVVDQINAQDGASAALLHDQTDYLNSLKEQLSVVDKIGDSLQSQADKMRSMLEPAQNIANAMRDWTKKADPRAAQSENVDAEIAKGEAALKRMRDAASSSGGESPFGGLINSDDYAKASAALDALKAKRDATFEKDTRKDVELGNLQSQADGKANAVNEAQRVSNESSDYFSRMNRPASDTGEAADLYREAYQRKLDDEAKLAEVKKEFALSQANLEAALAGKNVAARVAAELKANEVKRQGANGDPTKLNEVAAERAGIEQRMNDDAVKKAATALDTEIDGVKDNAAQKVKILQEDVREHTLTAQQGAAAEKAVLDQEAIDLKALLDRKAALYVADSDKRGEIERETQKQIRAIRDEEAQEQRQAAEASAKAWESATNKINSAFDSQISGLLRGTTSWGQAAKNVLATMVEDATKSFLNMELLYLENQAKHAAMNLGILASDTTTQAAATGAHAAGAAAQKAIDSTTIAGDAGRAAAGAYAAMAGVPLIGPVLAPAAAAVAYGGAMAFSSFDIGAWNVPQDQLALIHRNELVMPAAEAGALRTMLSGAARGGGGDDGGGGRPITVSPQAHFHINSMDSASVESTLRNNSSAVMKAIEHGVRSGAHLGMRRINQ